MINKENVKKKFPLRILAVLLVILSLFTVISVLFFPKKSASVDSAGASGFNDVIPNADWAFAINVVYADDTNWSTSTGAGAVDPTPNGFSLVEMLGGAGAVRERLTNAVWIYLNFIGRVPVDLVKYDLLVSDPSFIHTVNVTASNGGTYIPVFNEIYDPLFPVRYYVLYNNHLNVAANQSVKSVYFMLSGTALSRFIDAMEFNYYDWYFLVADKREFSSWEEVYESGYDAGTDYGYEQGYNVGYERGDVVGYNRGYDVGLSQSSKFTDLMTAVFDVPVKTFLGLTDFEILGVNLSSFLLSLMTICLFVVIFRKLI